MIPVRAAAGLLILVIILASSYPYTAHASGECSYDVDYPIAVIAVSIPQPAMERLPGILKPWRELALIQGCIITFNITPIIADGGGIEAELANYLSSAYQNLGLPEWIDDPEILAGHPVYWVELTSFYRTLYNITWASLHSMGVRAVDAVVVIGDLDGVSRQYYASRTYNYTGGTLSLTGVRGWSGPLALTFFDLTVIPRPRPEPEMPFYGYGEPVNYKTDPPVWAMSPSYLPHYIASLVRDHVRYHIINVPLEGYTPLLVNYNITIIDFGNDRAIDEVLRQVSPREVEWLTKTMAPWLWISVRVNVVNASRIPGLLEYIGSLEPGPDGYIEIDYYTVRSLLASQVPQSKGFPTLTYTFFILATGEPSRMRVGNLRFTGFSMGLWGATSWPGHGDRVLKTGLPRILAHELGHSLGLGHPFEYQEYRGGRFMRWLMDWEASVMSYDNGAVAGFLGWGPYYSCRYEVLRLAFSYIISLSRVLGEDRGSVERMLFRAVEDPEGAVSALFWSYYAYSMLSGGYVEGQDVVEVAGWESPIVAWIAASLFLVTRRR